VSKADTSNAHVRANQPRQRGQRSHQSLEAERLYNDPAFQEAVSTVERGIVDLIVNTPNDGSPEAENAEREMCRSLRTLKRLPRVMLRVMQGEQLRLADFRAHDPEGEE